MCEEKEQYLSVLPFWEHLSEDDRLLVRNRCTQQSFRKGQLIVSSDSACMGVTLILKGGIRASLVSDEGREITLFRLAAGECCVSSASCVISQISFDTVISATDETELLIIPSSVSEALAGQNIYFEAYLYKTETERFSQAIWAIQQILFRRFDQRLAEFLLDTAAANSSQEIRLTQEEIAREVSSAREVVARMLRHFVKEGLVSVSRSSIRLLDPDGLRSLL